MSKITNHYLTNHVLVMQLREWTEAYWVLGAVLTVATVMMHSMSI